MSDWISVEDRLPESGQYVLLIRKCSSRRCYPLATPTGAPEMIESEAKTKWCPFVRFTHPYRGSHRRWNNRGNELKDGADDGAYCIGSECMAWQATDNKFDPQAPGESEKPGKPAGYCGLVK